MKKLNPAELWETASKRAYWDREVPLETWREKVRQGHPSYLPGAVAFLPADQFIRFYGSHRFALDWPAMQANLPTAVAGKAGMLNLLWSKLVGGGWISDPSPITTSCGRNAGNSSRESPACPAKASARPPRR